MGSSLTVTPAADIPKLVYAFLKINALCDDVMKKLVNKLELKVHKFVLHRQISFNLNKEKEICFRGVDHRGIPFSFFK
jgi:hypothetical protein